MGTVEVTFTPLPANVRTARLIATAVARRSGVEEPLLDEVRLAVGEACSRAVDEHRRHCPQEPIRLEMRDDSGRFEVVVTDAAPGAEANGMDGVPAADPVVALAGKAGAGEHGHTPEFLPPGVGLAVVAGLADDVDISSTPDGVRVRMSWPARC
ncbi:MAG: ATP-binding protein [Streptosporangiales bacterium]|nr:ATP-binding protein [Streptosporangiales bacterium]